jgi:hypothetical protein
MKKIIKKILKEDRRQMFLDKVIKYMKNDFPLFKNMRDYGFFDQLLTREITYILSGIFGEPVRLSIGLKHYKIYDSNNNSVYDEDGNEIYISDSKGWWKKKEYDEDNNQIYWEDSDGYWYKREYDERGKLIYSEDSNGNIRDNR